MSALVFRSARRHVREFSDESERLMSEHNQAIECMDCEAFLQLGIDAFDWLIRADQTIRKAVFQGKAEYDPDIDDAMQDLFRAWLKPCDFTDRWIEKQVKRGYSLDNLDTFRECERQVRAIVRSLDSDAENMPSKLRDLRDAALTEHERGETSDFV